MENLNQELNQLPQKHAQEKVTTRALKSIQRYYHLHHKQSWKMQHTQPLIHQQQIESIIKQQGKTLRKLQNIALILYLPVIVMLLYKWFSH